MAKRLKRPRITAILFRRRKILGPGRVAAVGEIIQIPEELPENWARHFIYTGAAIDRTEAAEAPEPAATETDDDPTRGAIQQPTQPRGRRGRAKRSRK